MIAHRVAAIAPSATLSINAKAQAMRKEGKAMINLSAGEPDFDCPRHVSEAARKALEEGCSHYTPVPGLPVLRAAIAKKLTEENGVACSAEQVLVSCGAKHSLYNIFQTILNEGDEAIIIAPYWVSYVEQIKLAGGKPIVVEGVEGMGAAITQKTKCIVLNTPSNPTGEVLGREALVRVGELAVERDLYIVADEIYEKLVYEGEQVSIASLSQEIAARTITINGVSKSYAMTGWRIGYAAGPKDIIKAASALQSHSTSNPTAIAQHAALAAITGPQDCVETMKKQFMQRRKIVLEAFPDLKGCQGAFYALVPIPAPDSVSFCEKLLTEYGVAAVPGVAFGAEGTIRISYATGEAEVAEGVKRVKQCMEAYK